MVETTAWSARDAFADAGATKGDKVLWLVGAGTVPDGLSEAQIAWLEAQTFSGAARAQAAVPAPDGTVGGVVFGLGNGHAGEPSGPSELLVGSLAQSLAAGSYALAGECGDPHLAAIAWGLGAYRFERYKSGSGSERGRAVLRFPDGVEPTRVVNTTEAVWFGRDLINTPASDLGPKQLEEAARQLAARHGAHVTSISGDELLSQNFPLIHAVGRASPRAPCLIDLTWGDPDAPKITLVGKGITFDTGGLDLKPASAMLLMKKDMGGAATALTLAHMIMGQNLPCRLRVIIAAAENSVSGDAFRPGDVLKSRAGPTVEVGNTDAEGRLVLADALALADEESPDSIFVFATLTGAARSALGPDLPAFFTDDDALGATLPGLGAAIGDPLWRMPLWEGYRKNLDSHVADMNNVWESPFAGAITAALFLRKFVVNARRFAHFDLYGWRPQARPLGPKGGEPQTARAVMEHLRRELTA